LRADIKICPYLYGLANDVRATTSRPYKFQFAKTNQN